jgi:hypothetical protein
MMEGAKYPTNWLPSSAETRASIRSPSSSQASQPPTLYAAFIDSKQRKLTGNHNPQINRKIRRSMMMNKKTIRIMKVMMIHIRIKMMARILRTKSLNKTKKIILPWQRKIKKSQKKIARITMTSYLIFQ